MEEIKIYTKDKKPDEDLVEAVKDYLEGRVYTVEELKRELKKEKEGKS